MPESYYVSQYSGEEIDALLGGAGTGTVRYDAAQTLTDAQKKQARENIEAQNGALVTGSFSTKGWYRIVTGTAYSGGILTVQHSYNNGGPSSLKLLVTLNKDGSSLKCIEYTNYTVSAITNARIVLNASGLCCIDVYYNVNGLNTGGIDFISMGRERAECQAPVYIGADDTLLSGETLKATMEYLNPPLALGVEYRTTERYLGKPVYVRLVSCGSAPSNSLKKIDTGLDYTVIDRRLTPTGNMYANSNDNFSIPCESTNVVGENLNIAHGTYRDSGDVRHDAIFIHTTSTTLTGYTVYVVLKYTKTTD